MKYVQAVILCALCLQGVKILVTPDGECIAIRTKNIIYPCTHKTKIDTGCWDEQGNTQLCGASWIEVEPENQEVL